MHLSQSTIRCNMAKYACSAGCRIVDFGFWIVVAPGGGCYELDFALFFSPAPHSPATSSINDFPPPFPLLSHRHSHFRRIAIPTLVASPSLLHYFLIRGASMGRDVGRDVGKDVGRDVGKEVGKEVGRGNVGRGRKTNP